MEFKKELLTNGVCINCKTEEQAEALLKWASANGKKWCTNQSYIGRTHWNIHKEETIYYIAKGTYGFTQMNTSHILFEEAIDLTKSQIVDPETEMYVWDDDGTDDVGFLSSIDVRRVMPYVAEDCKWKNCSPTKPKKTHPMTKDEMFTFIGQNDIEVTLKHSKKFHKKIGYFSYHLDVAKYIYRFKGQAEMYNFEMKD
jgi:hypothetical protein